MSVLALLDEMRPDAAGPYARLLTYVTDRPGHDRRYAIDSSKIENELGWKRAYDFPAALQKTVDWYLANNTWLERVRSGAYKDYYTMLYADR